MQRIVGKGNPPPENQAKNKLREIPTPPQCLWKVFYAQLLGTWQIVQHTKRKETWDRTVHRAQNQSPEQTTVLRAVANNTNQERLSHCRKKGRITTLLARICRFHHNETKEMTAEAHEKGGKSFLVPKKKKLQLRKNNQYNHNFNLGTYISVSEAREKGKWAEKGRAKAESVEVKLKT